MIVMCMPLSVQNWNTKQSNQSFGSSKCKSCVCSCKNMINETSIVASGAFCYINWPWSLTCLLMEIMLCFV